jgi:hypothetical protein
VASNFIDERGDIVFLDDIEVLYESEPPECGTSSNTAASYNGATQKPPSKGKKGGKKKGNGGAEGALSGTGNNNAGNVGIAQIGDRNEEEGIRRAGSGGNGGAAELATEIGTASGSAGTAVAVDGATAGQQTAEGTSALGTELEGGAIGNGGGDGNGGIEDGSGISAGKKIGCFRF